MSEKEVELGGARRWVSTDGPDFGYTLIVSLDVAGEAAQAEYGLSAGYIAAYLNDEKPDLAEVHVEITAGHEMSAEQARLVAQRLLQAADATDLLNAVVARARAHERSAK